ncbi:potassium-transporting ATPase subunit KdpC [Leeia sp.]|uniref:potassium-transporting ATPase subunit KdpC n=1 Tax=Leeia sp. TaxID=2884678 RepID=UPI0035ADDD95
MNTVDITPQTRLLRPALGMAMLTLLGFGLAYSLLATGLGRALSPYTATGSLVTRDGVVAGSTLLSQPFASARYFMGRPTASGHDPMAMAGSNLAHSNPELMQRITAARKAVAQREGVPLERVPADLFTQSGSGSDPHISPEAARLQIARVAQARHLPAEEVAKLVSAHTEGKQFGLLGQPRVNVLALNLALDTMK